MADPRNTGLGWPFVAVEENPYMGVEVSPNEIIYIVLGGTYRKLLDEYERLRLQHARLREAAQAQVEAANAAIDLWKHYGHRHD